MPSVSKKQHRFFAAIAHSPEFAKKAGVPQSVGQDFYHADQAAHKFAAGGPVNHDAVRDFMRLVHQYAEGGSVNDFMTMIDRGLADGGIVAGDTQLRLPMPGVMGGHGQHQMRSMPMFHPHLGPRVRKFADGGVSTIDDDLTDSRRLAYHGQPIYGQEDPHSVDHKHVFLSDLFSNADSKSPTYLSPDWREGPPAPRSPETSSGTVTANPGLHQTLPWNSRIDHTSAIGYGQGEYARMPHMRKPMTEPYNPFSNMLHARKFY